VALGWGLWEGPARFIFYHQVFQSRCSLPPSPIKIEPLDFTKKWHNIRHDDELELIRLNQMIQQATSQVDASPQSPLC
jgi:hypothetical protein